MSAKSPDSLRLDLGASRTLAAVLIVVHGGAVAIAALLPLALPVRIAVIALVLASVYRAVRDHALRWGGTAITAFVLDDGDSCTVRRGGADGWEQARLLDRWVHPQLTILVVRCRGRRWPSNIVIAADAVPAEAFRRLRVRLRLQTAAA